MEKVHSKQMFFIPLKKLRSKQVTLTIITVLHHSVCCWNGCLQGNECIQNNTRRPLLAHKRVTALSKQWTSDVKFYPTHPLHHTDKSVALVCVAIAIAQCKSLGC